MNTKLLNSNFTLLTLCAVAIFGGILPARAEINQSPVPDAANSVTNLSPDITQNISDKNASNSGSVSTSASTLINSGTQSQITENTAKNTTTPTEVAQVIAPGRATRSGPSYIGLAGNIGLSGDTTLGEGAFTVISKIGITQNLSARPAALIGDNTVFLIPLTLDFPQESLEVSQVSIAPYIGGGAAISTGRDSTVGGLISGGVDVPLSPQITGTAGVNVSFIDGANVGLLLGAGYTF
jgi:hypothetical protein